MRSTCYVVLLNRFKLFNNFKLLFLSFPILLLSSCYERLPESKEIAAEAKRRKIGRIKPADILEETNRLGKLIISATDSVWNLNLDKEIDSKTTRQNSSACIIELQPFRNKSLEDFSISKWGIENIKYSKSNIKEKEIFEAYVYNVLNKMPIASNIQKLGDTVLLYTQPIYFDKSKCKNCHTSGKTTDFAGMWSVSMSKKKIVENIWLNK